MYRLLKAAAAVATESRDTFCVSSLASMQSPLLDDLQIRVQFKLVNGGLDG